MWLGGPIGQGGQGGQGGQVGPGGPGGPSGHDHDHDVSLGDLHSEKSMIYFSWSKLSDY